MLKTVMFAALALACLLSPVEARQRQHATGLDPSCNVTMPCVTPYASSLQKVRETRGKYIGNEMGIGGPVHKRAVRVLKARQSVSYGVPSPSFGYAMGRPSRYIRGRLICAVNVGQALAERGIRGTGSALAMSYLHWGRSAGGPVPGAVVVSARRGGGHVAIVSRVENGVVFVWNATGGQRGWREIPYRHRVIDYRVPG